MKKALLFTGCLLYALMALAEIEIYRVIPGKIIYKLFCCPLPSRCRLVFGGLWGTSLDIQKLGRYYDPSYQKTPVRLLGQSEIRRPRLRSEKQVKRQHDFVRPNFPGQ